MKTDISYPIHFVFPPRSKKEETFLLVLKKLRELGIENVHPLIHKIESISNQYDLPSQKNHLLEETWALAQEFLKNQNKSTIPSESLDFFQSLILQYLENDTVQQTFENRNFNPLKMVPRDMIFYKILSLKNTNSESLHWKAIILTSSFWIMVYSLILYFLY